MPKNGPRLSLADLMILVGTTGFNLAIYFLVDNVLFNGKRYFFGVFRRPTGSLDTLEWVSRVGGLLTAFLTLFAAWTLVLPLLPLRKYRPQWRRLSRQPGISGCIAVAAGMLFWLLVAGGSILLRRWVEPGATIKPSFWQNSPIFDGLLVCSGCSVAAVWFVQIVTRRWRPGANGFDRLGRGLGILWIITGMTFAARLLLN